ncbi:MAG: hypothetical protein OQK46_04030 [Gammaproteobacteria bacterium]|nr:hypothetical protein [Gammaproteobacteria bacterium]
MKNYLLIAASVLGLGLLSGCTDSVTDSVTGGGETCIFTDTCDIRSSDLYTCANSSGSGWYEVGSQTFSYTTSTTAAACAALEYCNGGSYCKTSPADEDSMAVKFLTKAAENAQLKNSIDDMYIDLGNEVQK